MHETKQFTAIGSVCLLAQARADKSIRLVLILKNGLQDFAKVLQASGVSPLPNEAMQFLQKIDELKIFNYMLDLDVLADGRTGDMVGIELLPQNAILPARQ